MMENGVYFTVIALLVSLAVPSARACPRFLAMTPTVEILIVQNPKTWKD